MSENPAVVVSFKDLEVDAHLRETLERRCQALTEEHADLLEDFDRAYALEALARANAVAGNREEALRYKEQAEHAGQAIADEESRKYFVGDLAGGNWGSLA